MSGNFFSKFDSEYFSLIIFLKYLLILLLMLIFVTKMTLLEKNKICRTFRAVGHLGTLQTSCIDLLCLSYFDYFEIIRLQVVLSLLILNDVRTCTG